MSKPKQTRRVRNLSLAGVAGLAGLATISIVFTALFLGLWLDALFGLRGPLTITLLIASVPVSLFTMLKIVLGLVGQLTSAPQRNARDVEEDSR